MYGDGGAGGNRRRRDRGPARRGLCGEQGVSAQRGPQIGDCGLRAQSAAIAHRSARPLSAALAGTHSARGDRRRVRAAARRQARSLRWGVSNFDTRRHAVRWPRFPTGDSARRTRCSITSASAASNGICCPGCASGGCPSWRTARSDRARCCATAGSPRSAPRLGATPAQVALAWLLARADVIAIPESSDRRACARESRGGRSRARCRKRCAALDAAFPPPPGPTPLAVV